MVVAVVYAGNRSPLLSKKFVSGNVALLFTERRARSIVKGTLVGVGSLSVSKTSFFFKEIQQLKRKSSFCHENPVSLTTSNFCNKIPAWCETPIFGSVLQWEIKLCPEYLHSGES